MQKKILLLMMIAILLLVGCSTKTKVKLKSVISINDTISEEYLISTPIETYIIRPSLEWNIVVKDSIKDNSIFYDLLDMIKSQKICEEIKEEYSNYFFRIYIRIYNEDNEMLKEYFSEYYVAGSSVSDDESKNKIDNFTTWTIKDLTTNESSIYIFDDDSL